MRAAAVLYALDLPQVGAFYADVAGLPLISTAPDHLVLRSEAFELVVVAIPPAIAATIEVARPAVRRTQTPIKLVFPVASLATARAAAAARGGVLDPPAREWTYEGWRVCDGHDPEGNVLQLREPLPNRAHRAERIE